MKKLCIIALCVASSACAMDKCRLLVEESNDGDRGTERIIEQAPPKKILKKYAIHSMVVSPYILDKASKHPDIVVNRKELSTVLAFAGRSGMNTAMKNYWTNRNCLFNGRSPKKIAKKITEVVAELHPMVSKDEVIACTLSPYQVACLMVCLRRVIPVQNMYEYNCHTYAFAGDTGIPSEATVLFEDNTNQKITGDFARCMLGFNALQNLDDAGIIYTAKNGGYAVRKQHAIYRDAHRALQNALDAIQDPKNIDL